MKKKKRPLYATYKRLTSDLKTHRLNIEMGKDIPCKWKFFKKVATHIGHETRALHND